jgi:hypothetical protein
MLDQEADPESALEDANADLEKVVVHKDQDRGIM